MELYLSPQVVGKGKKGRTACGSAAYRSCSKIYDNNGRRHDYRHKKGYVMGGVELPEGAPEELRDRQTLWGRHEPKDIRKDAELFREIVLAFPNVLDYVACAAVLRQLSAILTEKGMCVQWDIHDTTKRGKRNLHAHLMITMRTLQRDGTFGNKDRSWNKYNGGLNIANLLRPEAARLMNEELEKIGSEERIEHESFKKRGIDRIPTVHVGLAGTAIAGRGETSYRKKLNDAIRELNAEHMTYVERVEKLREKRAAIDRHLYSEMEDKPGIHDIIDSYDSFTMTSKEISASKGKLQERIEESYQVIREAGAQIYDLRKEKKQTDKLRYALQLFKHLAGEKDLTDEQKEKLAWATGYLRWANGKDPTMEEVMLQIEEVRELNTQRCIALSGATKRRDDAYEDIKAARHTMREIGQEQWRRSRGIYR